MLGPKSHRLYITYAIWALLGEVLTGMISATRLGLWELGTIFSPAGGEGSARANATAPTTNLSPLSS